jgi:stage IV sporulation protein FB
MILQEPAHSPYDLRFLLMGFPVRISWTFWLGSCFFGFGFARDLDDLFGLVSPGLMPLLVLWMLCIFVSILIHELGHALAFRRNGLDAAIVLYHFGGLAIPTSSFQLDRSFGGLSPKQQIWISFAGPLLQVVSAVVLIVIVKLAGYELWVFQLMPDFLQKIPGMLEGSPIDSPGLLSLITFYIYPSIVWALLNLVPVYPLDGGQIMKSIVDLRGGTMIQSLWISVITAGLMAAYGFSSGQTFLGILFLILGITNFQAIQQQFGGHY